MPNNKAEKIKNRQNDATFTEEAITLNSGKASKTVPSLNQISKQKS